MNKSNDGTYRHLSKLIEAVRKRGSRLQTFFLKKGYSLDSRPTCIDVTKGWGSSGRGAVPSFGKINWAGRLRGNDVLGLALVIFCHVLPLHADAGTSAANFLKIGIGARGSAMGDAQAAMADDASASYWNPALLSGLRFNEISLMHYDLAEGVRFQQLTVGAPTNHRGSFGGSISLLDYGDIAAYDTGGVRSGTVDASNLLISGSWARTLSDRSNIAGGLTVKYLQSDLAGYKASVPMADFGFYVPFTTGKLRGLRLATGFRNLGPNIKYDQESSPLPRQFVLGSGFSALGGNLSLALDSIKPTDGSSYIAAGAEYRVFEVVQLRVGYNGNRDLIGTGVTYGMGLKFTQWNIDYAFVPLGSLGSTNRISLGVRFGHGVKMKSAEEQVEYAYKSAQRQLALGKGVEAYKTLNDILLIAPWHKPSVEFKARIEKQFEEMAASKNRARMDAEIADEFSRAKEAFDKDELVEARKGFEAILKLQSDHIGAKVYLERIQNRYASLASEAFKQGMDYFAAGDYQKAKSAFEKTLTIDPYHIDAKAQLAKTEDLIKDAAKRAEEMFRLAGAAEAYKAGLAAYQKNDLETALAKFEEVKAAVPEYEEVGRYYDLTKKLLGGMLFDQSKIHVENGQLDQAVKKLQRSAELIPEDPRVKPALDAAQRDLAVKNAEESKKLYKEGLEAYLSGQTEKARQSWKKALELDSRNEDALNAITKLEQQKKSEESNEGR